MPAHESPAKNYGDNLAVLRDYIPDNSVDLIYLDPPFNSRQDYNVLFAEKDGSRSASQITAFKDTWEEWDEEASRSYHEVVERGGKVADAMRAFRTLLGGSDMLAYLAMMAPRLVELRRVLKETGSIYLHCDPTASHYLKLLMDSVFGPKFFKNEIIWKRTSSHNDASQGLTRYGRSHDTILFSSKSDKPAWNLQFKPYDDSYLNQHYANKVEGTERRYKTSDLTAAKPGGDTSYEWKGVKPPRGRYWAYSKANMEQFDAEGRLTYAPKSGMPRLKHYLDEMPGVTLSDIWTDIPPINSQAQERLGYPTQKPEALLERILRASSNEGDVVLDPFCGCGTTVQVAQKLNRRWIGIDVTHLAIGLIKTRLDDSFGPEILQKRIRLLASRWTSEAHGSWRQMRHSNFRRGHLGSWERASLIAIRKAPTGASTVARRSTTIIRERRKRSFSPSRAERTSLSLRFAISSGFSTARRPRWVYTYSIEKPTRRPMGPRSC